MGTGGDDLGAANAETAAAGGRRRAANRSSHTPTAAPSCCSVQEFYRASLQLVQGTMGALPQGYLLLMRKAEDGAIEDGERALVLAVGGDTLQGVAMLMQGQASERPLSLDLLWAILERGQVRGGCGEWGWHARVGLVLSSSTPQPHAPPPPHSQEISKTQWRVLRVAIVELRGNTYIGRLFFGDADSGHVAWDTDCRPSDACWLSLKSGCPFFIRREVGGCEWVGVSGDEGGVARACLRALVPHAAFPLRFSTGVGGTRHAAERHCDRGAARGQIGRGARAGGPAPVGRRRRRRHGGGWQPHAPDDHAAVGACACCACVPPSPAAAPTTRARSLPAPATPPARACAPPPHLTHPPPSPRPQP